MGSNIGVVVIGRDEGERLMRCLASLPKDTPVVYVDSGSKDGSIATAKRNGASVVDLDLSVPFTAARSRNAGFKQLLREKPDLVAVQFIDADCELSSGWLETARAALASDEKLAVAAGSRRERFPDSSPYARLCSLEWDWPAGETDWFSGDALIRAAAFKDAAGFNAALIAGEEGELCLRLKRAGWTCRRYDVEMSIHECGMTRFNQWWTRAVRTGYGYAHGFALYGFSGGKYARKLRNITLWGFALPMVAFAEAPGTGGSSLCLFVFYPVLFWRYGREARRRGLSADDARLWAFFNIINKFPQFAGNAVFWFHRALGRGAPVIRYK